MSMTRFKKWQGRALLLMGLWVVPTQAAPQDFSSTVKPLLPAVVNISTTMEISSDKRMQGFGGQGNPLEELFRQFLEEQQGGGGGRTRKSSSLGSGFIISQEGKTAYVVTCNHVVAEADEIKITLHDGDDYKAEIVGRDPRTDLALLKFQTDKTVTTASWGDSKKAEVGQWIIAIGNPFGLSSTVTVGIISTLGRDISARASAGRDGSFADYVDGYIQTDASINMGNSGGPMFDMDGHVIAISTAIFSPNGGNIGIGFGIPADLAQQVINQLRQYGKTKRGWLGVRIQNVTPEIATSLGLSKHWGALVGGVSPKSPASLAGVQTGDVILKFNGVDIKESRSLPRLVGETEIGKSAPMLVWRDGKEITLHLKVGEFEQAESEGLLGGEEEQNDSDAPATSKPMVLGMQFTPATPDQKKGSDTPGETGLTIIVLDPRSEAAEKGLRPGDVLLEATCGLSKIKPKTSSDFDSFVKKARADKGKQLLLLVSREGNPRYLTLALEEEKKDDKKEEKKKKKSGKE